MLIYYALNITSLKVTDRAKSRVRNSPIFCWGLTKYSLKYFSSNTHVARVAKR